MTHLGRVGFSFNFVGFKISTDLDIVKRLLDVTVQLVNRAAYCDRQVASIGGGGGGVVECRFPIMI